MEQNQVNQENNFGVVKKSSGRGFASMDKERQREISAKGGREAHRNGTAHEFNSEEARAAGRKGGEARHANRLQRAAMLAREQANANNPQTTLPQ